MLVWVDCQSLINSLNNLGSKPSLQMTIGSGQEFYYSWSLSAPCWRKFQPFCKVVGCWQHILIAYFCLKQRLTHIKTKPKQNKTVIHWWSHEIELHKGCTCLTWILLCNTNTTSPAPMLFTLPALYPVFYMKGNHQVFALRFALIGDFLTRMLRQAEGRGDIRSLPILKGDVFTSLNFVAF